MITKSTLFSKIGEMTIEEWDPIGVGASNESLNEYSAYIEEIYNVLSGGGGVSEIYECLRRIETQSIGIPGDAEWTKRFAEKLVELRNMTGNA